MPPNNEKQLLQAVANQPVSVGISGGGRAFQLYSKVGSLGSSFIVMASNASSLSSLI